VSTPLKNYSRLEPGGLAGTIAKMWTILKTYCENVCDPPDETWGVSQLRNRCGVIWSVWSCRAHTAAALYGADGTARLPTMNAYGVSPCRRCRATSLRVHNALMLCVCVSLRVCVVVQGTHSGGVVRLYHSIAVDGHLWRECMPPTLLPFVAMCPRHSHAVRHCD
jgi:hypothetical protein